MRTDLILCVPGRDVFENSHKGEHGQLPDSDGHLGVPFQAEGSQGTQVEDLGREMGEGMSAMGREERKGEGRGRENSRKL